MYKKPCIVQRISVYTNINFMKNSGRTMVLLKSM